jgi:hypothetical protein
MFKSLHIGKAIQSWWKYVIECDKVSRQNIVARIADAELLIIQRISRYNWRP